CAGGWTNREVRREAVGRGVGAEGVRVDRAGGRRSPMTQRAASSKGRAGAEWLAEIREQAAQRFAQLGWPTTQLEEWKFTSLTPISRVAWQFADGPAAVDTRGPSLKDRAAA